MRVAPYAVGRHPKTGLPVEIALNNELPTDKSLTVEFEVGERFPGDHFGNNLILSFYASDLKCSVHDIIIPDLPSDLVSALKAKAVIKIVDQARSVVLLCNLGTALVA